MKEQKILKMEEQLVKLNSASNLAKQALKSTDVVTRLGALALHAGIVDGLVIQAARLFEQIILKGQLAEGKQPQFQPSSDSHFYDSKKATGFLLKGMRKLLPFGSTNIKDDVASINHLANDMIDRGFNFLQSRNIVMHQIANPKRKLEDMLTLCDKANNEYEAFVQAHTKFAEKASPYSFSKKEYEYFYGPDYLKNL
jgi:hypothetical protein